MSSKRVNPDFSDFKVDSVALNDLDFWDKGAERGQTGYVVTSRPGHLEARWEQQTRYRGRLEACKCFGSFGGSYEQVTCNNFSRKSFWAKYLNSEANS